MHRYRIPLREGAFLFTSRTLFPPLDKRNTCDKAKGLRIASARHIGELSMRCLSTLNRGQGSVATVSRRGFAGVCVLLLWRGVWEGLCRGCGVGFRKGRYVHLYSNCIVGTVPRGDF